MSHAVPNGVDGFQQLLFVELREEDFERMLMLASSSATVDLWPSRSLNVMTA